VQLQDARSKIKEIRRKFTQLRPILNEKLRRLWAASEAHALGLGGIAVVSKATELSRTTVREGMLELAHGLERTEPDEKPRIRRPGAGRPRLEKADPELLVALDILIEPLTRGDPESPLRWTSKSARKLATELTNLGHKVSPQKITVVLKEMGYSLQGNRKTREGASHPDRNAQFEYISKQVKAFQRRGQPVISVDTKKKELVGDFKNAGREWGPAGQPEEVRVHDFIDPKLGKAVPYGVYDLTANEGWVSVGIDHDTSEFAVETIRRWWQHMGMKLYPKAKELLITADSGGSNSARARLWKVGLQRLATELGISITVAHLPPGTSKWNKIEHRMFSFISINWRGKPLTSLEVIVNLIAGTTTTTGLKIQAKLDANSYAKGVEVPDDVLAAVQLIPARFHGEWNYRIAPLDAS
jgi:hypothetical protein